MFGNVSRQLVRWGAKAAGGLAANLALLTLWVDGLGFAAWWAVGINWLLLSVVGYVVTDQWVFASATSPGDWPGRVRRWLGAESVMLASKAVNYVIYLALLSLVDYRVAWTIGAVASFTMSFCGTRWLWTGRVSTRS
jgi:putative flippase GtrA